MDSLAKKITIMAVVILGTQAAIGPHSAVHSSTSSGVPKKSARAISDSGSGAAVGAEGVLEIVSKVDIHVIVGLLQHIPLLKDTVLQLVSEVRKLKDKDNSAAAIAELRHFKSTVDNEFMEFGTTIQNLLGQSREAIESMRKSLQDLLDEKANSSDTCTISFLKEITTKTANAIIKNDKDVMVKLINRQVRPELAKIATAIEDNTKLLRDVENGLRENQIGAKGAKQKSSKSSKNTSPRKKSSSNSK